jgi:HK97 family phage major capsid protein/HK97 family phage prohead protease
MDLRIKTSAAPAPGGDPHEFVMSDASVDRMGDVIEQDGWQLANFRRNPIALFGHSSGFPIGKWADVAVKDGRLTGRLELMPPASERLREIHAAIDAGVLRAVSVGFHPIDMEPLEDSKVGGLRFTKQELVECSLVSVPANPNALSVARAIGLSRETQRLIFGALADDGQAMRTRGLSGALADPSNRKPQAMNISEQIESAQVNMNALRDRLSEHLTANAENLQDDEVIARSDELTASIDATGRLIASLKRSEAALASSAEPERAPAARTGMLLTPDRAPPPVAPRPFAMPKRKEEPGELIINAAIIAGMMRFQAKSYEQALAERGWSDNIGVRTMCEWNTRAATTPANTTTPAWAGALVQQQWADLISALTIMSVYGPLSAYGARYTLGRFGLINIPIELTTPTIAGSFVAEGAPIPVRQGAFSTTQIGLKKMAVITSYTRELFEHSTPNIDTQLRDMIGRHTSVAIDTVLLDTNPATTIRPAGLRNGVSGLTPTAGGGFNALVADLKALLGVLVAANSVRSPVWLMNPQQALSISLTQSAAGVGVFPFREEIMQGRLNGYPVIQSTTVPVTTVILLDAADFASLTGDDPRFELSDVATLHMEDTSPVNIGTPGTPNVVAAPVQSMFQTDSIALRMILPMNWIMRRTGLVAWVTGVTW